MTPYGTLKCHCGSTTCQAFCRFTGQPRVILVPKSQEKK